MSLLQTFASCRMTAYNGRKEEFQELWSISGVYAINHLYNHRIEAKFGGLCLGAW